MKDGPVDGVDPGAPPSLTVTGPGTAAYLSDASVTVTGQTVNLEAVTVNGTPASLDAGTFSAPATLSPGMNLFDVRGTDAAGKELRELRAALMGQFQAPDGYVEGAVQVHLAPSELAAIAPLLGGMLDPAQLSGQITAMNPVVDDGTILANVTGVEFGEPIVIATPGEGVLELQIVLPDFRIPIEVETQLLFIPITLDGALATDEVVVTTFLTVDTDGQGGLDVALSGTDAEMVNFQIDIDGLWDFIEDMFIDDADAEAMLVGELDSVLAGFNTMADDLMADLDLSMETELMGQTLSLAPWFAEAVISPTGMVLGVDLQLDVSGAAVEGPGHLLQGAPAVVEGDAVTVVLADDFMNRFLHELWAAGAVDIDLPIEAGGLESVLLQMFGGQQGQGGSLSLRAGLPPTWIGRGDQSRLQLGSVVMTVETPGGAYGDVVELQMAVDAKAELGFTETGAGVVLSAAEITLNPIGDDPRLDELRAGIGDVETAMGIGIGLLNDLLSFPLEGIDTSTLPEIDLQRDPSGRGMRLQLGLADLAGLLGAADPADPTTPGSDPNADPNPPLPPPDPAVPAPMEVAIPATATVYDSDVTVDFDGETGWICRNDEVEALGNTGTWYVDDRGQLVVVGTGHVIYAYDDAEVTLESGGNTVYADVGADITDQAGTNDIIWVDPLDFDLAAAPADGC